MLWEGGERDGKHRSFLGFKGERKFNPTIVVLKGWYLDLFGEMSQNVSMRVVISQVSNSHSSLGGNLFYFRNIRLQLPSLTPFGNTEAEMALG